MATNLATLNPLTCRVLPQQLELLDRAAAVAGVSRSVLVRRAVVAHAKVLLAAAGQ